jgi:hypothetical protein
MSTRIMPEPRPTARPRLLGTVGRLEMAPRVIKSISLWVKEMYGRRFAAMVLAVDIADLATRHGCADRGQSAARGGSRIASSIRTVGKVTHA